MNPYEQIVLQWYERLRHDFIDALMARYKNSKMRMEDAENIYQDVFMAIHDNLAEGRVSDDTAWRSYIMRIGLNMASKKYREISRLDNAQAKEGEDDSLEGCITKVREMLRQLPEEEYNMYTDPDTQAVLGEELMRTPEPCASLIRLHYYAGLKDSEILEEMPQYSSRSSVKVVRNRCMKEFIYRVKLGLYTAGIITVKPERR